jgi:hypothetical protein
MAAFELDGEECIAVAAGGTTLWGGPKGGSVFVFRMPKKWQPAINRCALLMLQSIR